MKEILTLKDKIRIYKKEIIKLEKELENQTTIEVPAHKFEVYHKDARFKLNHFDAIEYCERIGNGWRLPTRKEQLEMYGSKEQLGLKDDFYWSITEFTTTNAFYFGFNNGFVYSYSKNYKLRVRAVRTIK